MNKFLALTALLPSLALAGEVCDTQEQLMEVLDINNKLGKPAATVESFGDLPKKSLEWHDRGDIRYTAWLIGGFDTCKFLEESYLMPAREENFRLRMKIKMLESKYVK